jgi:tetratricopeptide (TPR) repeat protein
MRFARTSLAAVLALAPLGIGNAAHAQDGPLDIDVSTSRVGGSNGVKGAKPAKGGGGDEDADDRLVTEDTLPKIGSPKRIPALHIIAKRYVGGKLWPEACARFDQISEEGGSFDEPADAKKNAGRAYLACAERAFNAGDFDKTEALIKKSEANIPSDDRHKALRRKMQKESYKRALANGDLDRAVAGYNQYQASGSDEDQRIWMGEQLAKMSWEAYKLGDKTRLLKTLEQAKKIAPMNSELRKLEDKIDGDENVVSRLVGIAALAALVVAALTALSRWRSRARVEGLAGGVSFGGKKNKYLEDE